MFIAEHTPKIFMQCFIAFVFFLVLCSSVSYSQINTKALAKSAKRTVVTIHCYNSTKQEYGAGTGFFISPIHLLTCRHVVQGASEVRCFFSDSAGLEIDGVLAEDSTADLVMLECKSAARRHIHPLKLAKELPEEGEAIVVVGSPLGLDFTVSKGIVSSIRESSPVGKAIQFTAPVSFGNSGSPVLNPKGEVIGIAALIMNEGENLNFAAAASSALNLKQAPLMTFPRWLHKNDRPSVTAKSESSESKADAYQKQFVGGYAYGRGADYMAQKNYDEAINMFATAVSQMPDNADYWYGLGDAFGCKSRFQEAANAMEHAVKLYPEFPQAWLRLGKAYLFTGDADKSEAALEKAIADKSTKADAWYSLAELYRSQHRYQKSIDAGKECVKLNVVSDDLYAGMAHCYLMLKEYSEARDADKKSLYINPYHKDALADLAVADMQLRELAEGAKYLEFALKHSPDDVLLSGYLGDYYREMKKYPEAINIFQHQLTISPDYAPAHQSYGMALIESGDKQGAQQELQILRKLDKDRANELQQYIVGFK
jgi:tetratricopeptide (TPR) repeat protein